MAQSSWDSKKHLPERNAFKDVQPFMCQKSGIVYPVTEIRRQWDGLYVHTSHFDEKHKNDFPEPSTREFQSHDISSKPPAVDELVTIPATPIWK
jgi:hypothetical protein